MKPSRQGVVREEDGVLRVATAPRTERHGVVVEFPGNLDLSDFGEIVCVVSNRSEKSAQFTFSVRTDTTKGGAASERGILGPHECAELSKSICWRVALPEKDLLLEGLHTYDARERHGCISETTGFQPDKVAAVYLEKFCDGNAGDFDVLRIYVRGRGAPKRTLKKDGFFPFVDKYGQNKHADYPGKVRCEGDFAAAAKIEEKCLSAWSQSGLRGADRFGGWGDGPQLEATGFFRTEKMNGKWWFVDPDGRLFYSQGVNTVTPADSTGVTFREKFYDWLPEPTDPTYGSAFMRFEKPIYQKRSFYGKKEHAPFWYFSFQRANLIRKYGEKSVDAKFVARTERRMRAWGLNTMSGWGRIQLFTNQPHVVYTKFVRIPGPALRCEAARGMWSVLPDAFAPAFRENARQAFAAEAQLSGQDPWCLGWYVDNEMAWGATPYNVALTVLQASADQASKRAFREALEKKYGVIAALNAAWGTAHADWDGFQSATTVPDVARPAVCDDLAALNDLYVRTYFSTVRVALKEIAPHRLYLGCRIHKGPISLYRIASEYCDVMSVNCYRLHPGRLLPSEARDVPTMITEFHFGALDRGILNAGLVPVADQRAVVESLKAYLEEARDNPSCVGTHYFSWVDETITGRKDAECFQHGLVSVVDEPYWEKVETLRAFAQTLYETRAKAPGSPQ